MKTPEGELLAAKLSPLDLAGIAPRKDVITDYNGFPWWHGLLVQPNREQHAADWLKRVKVFAYLPTFTRQVRVGGIRSRVHRAKLYAVLPGLLFIPSEMLDMPRRDEVFDYAGVRGFIRTSEGQPKQISKADIELVRIMEAKLNLPPEAKGVLFKLHQRVRFVDGSLWQGWGQGLVIEIASEHKIGVEIDGLFGRRTKVYVAASEIEAL